MSAVIASMAVIAVGAGYQAYEGHKTRKEAKAEKGRIEAREREEAAALEAEAKKKKDEANRRMRSKSMRTGHAGTVLGGAEEVKSRLGDI